jgi:hypothetical protein
MSAPAQRFIILVSITGDAFHRDSQTIMSTTLRGAERQALDWLLAKRLTAWRGYRWNRWSVMSSGSPHTIPRIVSWGNERGILTSGYQHGWTDPLGG